MNTTSNSAIATATAGLALLIPASIGLFFSGGPTIVSPLPALTFLSAFAFAAFHHYEIAAVVPMIFFFVWQPSLFRGDPKIPKRSFLLFVVATVLSILYFVFSWRWGVEYEGIRYTRAVCAVNIIWVSLLGLAFGRAWRGASSFRFNLLVHWMLFAWFAWYAFPTLGELP